MAQQNTGLGWSAKTEYAFSDNRYIGSIVSAPSWDSDNLPMFSMDSSPMADDVVAAGFYLFSMNGYSWNCALKFTPTSAHFKIFLYTGNNRLNYAIYTDTDYTGSYGLMTAKSMDTWPIYDTQGYLGLSYDTSTGLYYAAGFFASSAKAWDPATFDPGVPVYASLQEGLTASAGSTTNYYKITPGWAVCCFASWYSMNGEEKTGPVLISTVPENCAISTNGQTPSPDMATDSVLYDGARFTISLIASSGTVRGATIPVISLLQFGAMATMKRIFAFIAHESYANILITETIDPYEGFGYTEEDVGDINPNPQDDDIDIDDLPTRSFATAGFCRIYNPDVSDLNDLASYMWTDTTFLQTVINHLKQILENPIEAIISLSMVPVQPPALSNKVPVNVMFINTGVEMRPVTNQFVSVDCGTAFLEECYGGALDYNPYTRVQVYLPYIGIVQLDTDEVMNKTIHIVYHIDVVTGVCCAEIKADRKLLYQFSGHCSISQPITSADFSSYLNAALAAAKVAVGVATGMAATTAAAAAATTPPAVEGSSPTGGAEQALAPASSTQAIGPYLGSVPKMARGSSAAPEFADTSSKALWGELSKPGNVNTVASAMGGKMVVQHSGGFSGNTGYLAKRRPYLIITRPRIANPENYAQHFGRTSMEYLTLGSCTGYTKVESVHLTSIPATNPELSEISTLLKGGVIF